jgi:hypothetical protein
MNWNDRNVVLVMQQFESGHAMTIRTVLIVNIDLVNVHAIEYRVKPYSMLPTRVAPA